MQVVRADLLLLTRCHCLSCPRLSGPFEAAAIVAVDAANTIHRAKTPGAKRQPRTMVEEEPLGRLPEADLGLAFDEEIFEAALAAAADHYQAMVDGGFIRESGAVVLQGTGSTPARSRQRRRSLVGVGLAPAATTRRGTNPAAGAGAGAATLQRSLSCTSSFAFHFKVGTGVAQSPSYMDLVSEAARQAQAVPAQSASDASAGVETRGQATTGEETTQRAASQESQPAATPGSPLHRAVHTVRHMSRFKPPPRTRGTAPSGTQSEVGPWHDAGDGARDGASPSSDASSDQSDLDDPRAVAEAAVKAAAETPRRPAGRPSSRSAQLRRPKAGSRRITKQSSATRRRRRGGRRAAAGSSSQLRRGKTARRPTASTTRSRSRRTVRRAAGSAKTRGGKRRARRSVQSRLGSVIEEEDAAGSADQSDGNDAAHAYASSDSPAGTETPTDATSSSCSSYSSSSSSDTDVEAAAERENDSYFPRILPIGTSTHGLGRRMWPRRVASFLLPLTPASTSRHQLRQLTTGAGAGYEAPRLLSAAASDMRPETAMHTNNAATAVLRVEEVATPSVLQHALFILALAGEATRQRQVHDELDAIEAEARSMTLRFSQHQVTRERGQRLRTVHVLTTHECCDTTESVGVHGAAIGACRVHPRPS